MMNHRTSDRWKHGGLSDLDYTIVQYETTSTADGFFEIHRVKVLGQVDWTPPSPARRHRAHDNRQVDATTGEEQRQQYQSKNGPPPVRQQPLEFIHIMHTGGDLVERAGAGAGIAWGACHYNDALFQEMHCPSPQGKFTLKYYKQSPQWHVYLSAFADVLPIAPSTPKFAIVRNPYERAVAMYFDKWSGYMGANSQDPANLNKFIQRAIRRQAEEETVAYLPQYRYIFQGHHRIVANLLHYENLHKEFALLMNAYGLNNVTLKNTSPNHDVSDRATLGVDNLTHETVHLINQYAKVDFALFDYEMKRTPFTPKQQSSGSK